MATATARTRPGASALAGSHLNASPATADTDAALAAGQGARTA
nr:hypothetical protein [Streptomyces sp. CHD11]